MIIHKFNTQTERQEFGGSAFIEISYCKLKPETKINKILNLTKLPIKSNDSLYIHVNDIDKFVDEYYELFGSCVCTDLNEYSGFDCSGVNYFSSDKLNSIKERILKEKPQNYEIVLDWLNECNKFNGFYILGI